jgi:sarcosine oxidase
MYTNTPDANFIVDRLGDHPNVVIASACSGHGFKFSSVIGEILADLVLDGETRHPIAFLSAERLASKIRD